MQSNQIKPSYRLGVLITSPKKADKAGEFFIQQGVPNVYRFSAQGTAPNDMIDILGLGSPDKSILLFSVATACAADMLKTLKNKVKLSGVDSGIAFTVPLNGASALLACIMNKTAENISSVGKDETPMEITHSLIVVTVNHGFSQDVMESARAAGAGGGTVIHSHRVGNEQEAGKWGLSFTEDKDMVLIVADNKSKQAIMSAIAEKCGMNSEAKGVVLSLPIDTVMGLGI